MTDKELDQRLRNKKATDPLTKEEYEFMLRRMDAQVQENIANYKKLMTESQK